MGRILRSIYIRTLRFRRLWLFCSAVGFGLLLWQATQLNLEEDINKTFPRTEAFKKYNNLYRNSSVSGNIIVAIGPIADGDASALIGIGDSLMAQFSTIDTGLVKGFVFDATRTNMEDAYRKYLRDLPYFLTVQEIDSMFARLNSTGIEQQLGTTIDKLRGFESLGTKRFLAMDPLSLGAPVLKRLAKLEQGNTFRILNGYTFSPDGSYLLIMVHPAYPPSETKKNTKLVEALESAIDKVSGQQASAEILLFGGPVIAVTNANRIKKDTTLVSILAGVLILLLLLGYFRKLLVPILFFLPAIFGITFALAVISLYQGSISAISVAAGTIVLGIAIDYSFHFFNHYRETGSVEDTIQDISSPMLLGSATTVAAFLSLNFLHSSVLADFGTFAGLSLIGTAFFALLVLPHLARWAKFRPMKEKRPRPPLSFKWKASLFLALLLGTGFLWTYMNDVQFEDDLNKINYFPERLQRAQDIISGKTDRENLFVLCSDSLIGKALEKCDRLKPAVSDSSIRSTVVTDVILTPMQITNSVNAWNAHVRSSGADMLKDLGKVGEKMGFRPSFLSVYDSIFHPFKAEPEVFYRTLFVNDPLYREFVFEGDDGYNIVSAVNLPKSDRDCFIQQTDSIAGLNTVARSSLAHDLISSVSSDLNFILIVTSMLVFVVLLLTYGRIELAVITFLPMVVSWIWILGLCGLFDIKFNMVNVLITTFIFGLGDDYAIFVSDGILSRYKYGKDNLKSFRSAIVLSALTTMIGTGVLIFSKHPALHSIAVLSLTGMTCVVVAALTLQPLLYDILINTRVKRGFAPLTLADMFTSALAFGWFLIGCVLLTIVLLILLPLPISRYRKQRIMITLVSIGIRSDVDLMWHAKQEWIDKDDQTKPAILIANHTSFVDLMLMIGSSNKLLLVTNDWVWSSPFFGFFIRFVDFIHAKGQTSFDLEKIKKKIDEGYSILIFPEGTRSRDGKMGRFKKGAFYLAEKLQLDILPVVLHGVGKALRKGDFVVNKSHMTIKYLPRIPIDDPAFGQGYSERAKNITRYFKAEHEKVRAKVETADYFADQVRRLYHYKGPVLEWYVRIKLLLEHNFKTFTEHCPTEGRIYDLGCGYGYLSHLLAMQSSKRQVMGLDYDQEKIDVAANSFYKGGNLRFDATDLSKFEPEDANCFIIKDVLHYLPAAEQESLLRRCGGKLNAGGVIIVRDGIKDEKKGHALTKMTEFFSTKLLGFNKTEHELEFLPEERIRSFATEFNLNLERIENNVSSNVNFVLSRK